MGPCDRIVPMSIQEIGCCGAYCKTCRAYVPDAVCKGCKLGYGDGGRDINKARCAIKVCCMRDKGLQTCADCPDFLTCQTIQGMYAKHGYKYGKYKQAAEFIREHGYAEFGQQADAWHGAYGRLE